MKTFIFAIMMTMSAVPAVADTQYNCLKASGMQFTLKYKSIDKLSFHNSNGIYGKLELDNELSNQSRLVYQGVSNNPLGHDAVEVIYMFDSSLAHGARTVKGAFRSKYYGPNDASVPVQCVKQSYN